MRGLLLLLAVVCGCAGAVGAQGPALRAGSRVRITSAALGGRPLVATVLAAESDTLILKPDGEGAGLVVPWTSVETLELGRWRTHVVEGALVGALTGLLFAAIAAPCEEVDSGDCSLGDFALGAAYELWPDAGTRLSVFGGLGLLAGAALGAGVRTEVWRATDRAGVSLGVTRGRAAVGLSFSF